MSEETIETLAARLAALEAFVQRLPALVEERVATLEEKITKAFAKITKAFALIEGLARRVAAIEGEHIQKARPLTREEVESRAEEAVLETRELHQFLAEQAAFQTKRERGQAP